ncbi:MAG: hypothetical protein GF353_28675 [Candidatus Lokiarchaeota archaeon]|nr:hypothetical protein [Candidatus Lokiarchaeota archaeon]MBD3353977.1 hypothetical protein [Candidatus Lokiarchaeota archaeon]
MQKQSQLDSYFNEINSIAAKIFVTFFDISEFNYENYIRAQRCANKLYKIVKNKGVKNE